MPKIAVKVPANVQSLYTFIRDVIYWYFIPTDWLNDPITRFEEEIRFDWTDDDLQGYGLEHTSLVKNLGGALIVFLGDILIDFIVLLLGLLFTCSGSRCKKFKGIL